MSVVNHTYLICPNSRCRVIPILFAKARLPERKVPTLLAITTQRIIQYGTENFKLEELPVDLLNCFLSTYRSGIIFSC